MFAGAFKLGLSTRKQEFHQLVPLATRAFRFQRTVLISPPVLIDRASPPSHRGKPSPASEPHSVHPVMRLLGARKRAAAYRAGVLQHMFSSGEPAEELAEAEDCVDLAARGRAGAAHRHQLCISQHHQRREVSRADGGADGTGSLGRIAGGGGAPGTGPCGGVAGDARRTGPCRGVAGDTASVELDAEPEDAHRLVGGVGEEGVGEARGVDEGRNGSLRQEKLWWYRLRTRRASSVVRVLIAIHPLKVEGSGVVDGAGDARKGAWEENISDKVDVGGHGDRILAVYEELDGAGFATLGNSAFDEVECVPGGDDVADVIVFRGRRRACRRLFVCHGSQGYCLKERLRWMTGHTLLFGSLGARLF